jgi:pyruvate dehydrogenase E2 component (dihydrolipoamide acetyltransferase)
MLRAQQTIPIFHVHKTADVSRLRAVAADNRRSLTAQMLPLIVAWLAEHPDLNAHFEDGQIRRRSAIDIGIAFAHRDKVLLVPTLRDCANWSAEDFVHRLAALRVRSRENAFLASDFRPPSFTVSNLGGTGIDSFTSLVTPPQVGVLSVAGAAPRPWASEETPQIRPTLPLTLGVDHRALDGMYAARALADLASRIEQYERPPACGSTPDDPD